MYDETMLKAEKVYLAIRSLWDNQDKPEPPLTFFLREIGGNMTVPVDLNHSWPGHFGWDSYGGFVNPNTRYITACHTFIKETSIISISRCGPKDEPRRWMGRTIALMRLSEAVRGLGYEVIARYKDGPGMVIPTIDEVGQVEREDFDKAWRAITGLTAWRKEKMNA